MFSKGFLFVRRAAPLLLLLLLWPAAALPAAAQGATTVSWVSHTDGFWDAPSNWSTGAVPGPGSDVVIDVPEDITVTFRTGTVRVNSLRSTNRLVLSGGLLTLDGTVDSRIDNAFTLSGGTLDGGNLAVNGLLTFSGGTMAGRGHTRAMRDLAITGDATKTLSGRVLTFLPVAQDGQVPNAEWSGAGNIVAAAGAVFNNHGWLEVQNDHCFCFGGGALPSFNNMGTLQITRYMAGPARGTSFTGVAFNNSGTVVVVKGNLDLGGGGTHSGMLETYRDTAVNFVVGIHNLNTGTELTGDGVFRVAGSGLVNLNAPALNVPRIEVVGGTLDGEANLTINGDLTWTGGTMRGVRLPTTTIASTATLTIADGSDKALIDRRIVNDGYATWSGAGHILGRGAAFENSGTFDVQNDQCFCAVTTFSNSRLLVKSAGAGTTRFGSDVSFNNHGWVSVESGTLELQGGGWADGEFDTAIGATIALTRGIYVTHRGLSRPAFTGLGLARLAGSASLDIREGAKVTANSVFELAGDASTFGPGTLVVAPVPDQLDSGVFRWLGGTMGGLGGSGGVTRIEPGARLSIDGSDAKTLRRHQLENAGAATWAGRGPIRLTDGAVFMNSGTLDVQGDAQGDQFVLGDASARFRNSGAFTKSAGTTSDTFFRDVPFVHLSGTVAVDGGRLMLEGGGTSSGPFVANAGASVVFSAGSYTFDSGTAFSGSGTSRVSGSATALIPASVTVVATNVFELAGFGTLDGAGTLTVSPSSGNPALGAFRWLDSAAMRGTGETKILGAVTPNVPATLTISGNGTKSLGRRVIDNAGAATWMGIQNPLQIFGGAVFRNSGTFDVQNDQLVHTGGAGGTGAFVNTGTFTKSAGTGATRFLAVAFDNAGAARVESGTLQIEGGGTSSGTFATTAGTSVVFAGRATTYELTGGGLSGAGSFQVTRDATVKVAGNVSAPTFDVAAAGASEGNLVVNGNLTVQSLRLLSDGSGSAMRRGNLSGTGTVTGSVSNGGRVRPGDPFGKLTINGNYTEADSGLLDIHIGPPVGGVPPSCPAFRQLEVTRTATIAGRLSVRVTSGCQFSPGTSFRILTHGWRVGTYPDTLPPNCCYTPTELIYTPVV